VETEIDFKIVFPEKVLWNVALATGEVLKRMSTEVKPK
jgi:hypothetical protein